MLSLIAPKRKEGVGTSTISSTSSPPILEPKKVILIKAVRAQSDQSISPLALPVSQFLLITNSVHELYLDILQSLISTKKCL